MGKIEDANNIQELGESALSLMTSSLASYQKVSISLFEAFTGLKPMDSAVCAENLQLWMGTAAKDMGNINTVWQQALKVMTPPAPPPPPAP
jgi:hypothetical protein